MHDFKQVVSFLLFLTVCSANYVLAQNFGNPNYFVDTLAARYPMDVTSADLNGDSLNDYLMVSDYQQLIWYANNGDSFDLQSPISLEGFGFLTFSVGDLDGDGDNDILYGSMKDDRIAWLENNGDGTFQSEHVINKPDTDYDDNNDINGDADKVIWVQAGDIDRDGDQDIVFHTSGYYESNGKLGWYLNQGGGTFSEQRYLDQQTFNYLDLTHLANLRGDSLLDVITTDGKHLKIYEYKKEEGFAAPVNIIESENSVPYGHPYQLGDINNDGYIDLLVKVQLSQSPNELHWFKNIDNDYFESGKPIEGGNIGNHGWHRSPFQLEDMDGDGDADIVEYYHKNNDLYWFENTNDGYFSGIHSIDSLEHTTRAHPLSQDIDGDGNMDLFMLHDRGVDRYMQQDDASFKIFPVFENSEYRHPKIFATGDVNDDGIDDVFTAFKGSDHVTGHLSQSDGSFIHRTINRYNSPWFRDDFTNLQLLDADKDQDLDLLVTVRSEVHLYRNDEGNFNDLQVVYADSSSTPKLVGDLDNDGDVDILALRSSTLLVTELGWFENKGDDNYQLHVIEEFSNQKSIRKLFLEDFDADGYLDILSHHFIDGITELTWRKNTGEGSFMPQQLLLNDPGLFSPLEIHDVNMDGAPDIVYFTDHSEVPVPNTIAWLENTGEGRVASPQQLISTTSRWYDLFDLADLDGDGDQDLVTNYLVREDFGFKTVGLQWHENEGKQSFANPEHINSWEQQFYSGIDQLNHIAFAQLTDDSQPDLIVLQTDNNIFGWGQNTIPQNSTRIDKKRATPHRYALGANFPNPFNPTTQIKFSLPQATKVELAIYDLLGRRVAKLVDGKRQGGQHKVTFDASYLSSGVYIYQLKADNFSESRKMLLVK